MQLLADDIRIDRYIAQVAAQGQDLPLVVELVRDNVREDLKGRGVTRFVVDRVSYLLHLRRIHVPDEFIHQGVYRIK